VFLLGALFLAGIVGPPGPGASSSGFGLSLMVTAAVAAVVASNPVRDRIAGILHMDPDNPVHTVALVLAVIMLGWQIAFVSFVDVLAAVKQQPPLTILDLFAQEVPFLIIAVTGVGLYIRRNGRETAARLGVVRPAWWQVTLALSVAGAFFAAAQAIVSLSQAWTPEAARNIDATTQHLLGGVIGDPFGVAALALLPAVCEEVLFRGALQPRLGLLVTALLFTSVHAQYSISFDTLAVFIFAIGLGLIRKYTNTTTSGICHATYNFLIALGVGITGNVLGLAVAAELVLVGLTAFALWSQRRQRLAAATNT
jgi:membrane protease YdiL (CAAX protease family)